MQRTFKHYPDLTEDSHKLHSHSPLTTRLLVNRGITTEDEAEKFLKPQYDSHMNDPLTMNDMEKAVVRVFEAIEGGEKIVVYADYDCDGIPGAVQMNDLFKKIGYENFYIYIPDRHDEGYGLNKEAIAKFIEEGVSLLFTIDLGTTDHTDIAEAQANGIDVIVSDHHLPHETLPKAFAIVNPKIGTYSDPMLCGSGVVFKFIQAFVKKYGEYYKINSGWEKWLLDMAGLATLSDMVPLVGENRIIARFGLQVFRKSPRPGIMQLLRLLKIDQTKLVEDDLTFMVTPRLNAASRMDSPMRAFELLSERDISKAGALAEHLTNINDERKRIVAQIMKEVKHSLSERTIGDVIVIGNPKWRIGVLGLVAGKICDEYDRPTFVWGREGAISSLGEAAPLKGSCRSNGKVNVVRLMETAKDFFIDFGGHELAGGFSVSNEHVHFLEEKLNTAFDGVKQDGSVGGAMIDSVLSLSDINEKTVSTIEALAPFGLGNPKPMFLFQNLAIKSTKQFGKEKNHLEITVADDKGKTTTAMSFFADGDTFSKKASVGEKVDLIATIEKSYFAGRTTLRLRIIDII
jgi:single-stranded-DNA-specific exonuclease